MMRLHTHAMSASVTLSPTRKVRVARAVFRTDRAVRMLCCAASVFYKEVDEAHLKTTTKKQRPQANSRHCESSHLLVVLHEA